MAVTLFMLLMIGVFIGVDIWLAANRTKGDTYSEKLRVWGRAWPPLRIIIAFGMGLLCGHWWWTPADVADPAPAPLDGGPAPK